jgi:hypothetical protein
LVAAALVGGLVTYALMGGFKGTESSGLPAQNLASGLVNSVRVGDPAACEMLTPSGQSDLVRLLGASPSRVATMTARHMDVCATVLVNAPPTARSHAMLPFLGVLGFSKDSSGNGGSTSGSDTVEWSQSTDGRYAVITLRNHGANGWLASSMRMHASCTACSS